MYKPLKTDAPIRDCAAAVKILIAADPSIRVFQKYTCSGCGSRQMMTQANKFFAHGSCGQCRHVTFITHCNYLLVRASNPEALDQYLRHKNEER